MKSGAYKRAMDELQHGIVDDDLFAKAFANSSGSEAGARSEYVKLRARQIMLANTGNEVTRRAIESVPFLLRVGSAIRKLLAYGAGLISVLSSGGAVFVFFFTQYEGHAVKALLLGAIAIVAAWLCRFLLPGRES